MVKSKKLKIIVPCYNEEPVLRNTNKILTRILNDLIKKNAIDEESQILYVDDGSRDKTWEIIEKLQHEDTKISGLKFSGNFGHQNALIAGIEVSKDSDYIVTIDADLQDNPQSIKEMVAKANEGVDIVYGVRSKRTSDSFFKRFTAKSFYKIMSLLGTKTIPNHADFRLINKRVAKAFLEYPEREMFLRGIFPSMGFKTSKVFYERKPREAGETKYPLRKMISFALNGITSFSTKPIKIVRNIGILFALIGLVYAVYVIVARYTGQVVGGWPSLIVSIWIIGGIQLVAIGIVGEYIGRIFDEVKHRPRYLIDKKLNIK